MARTANRVFSPEGRVIRAMRAPGPVDTFLPVARAMTSYLVMAAPLLLSGALQLMTARRNRPAAATSNGRPGRFAGTTMLDFADSALSPAAFTAVTVKRYLVPLTRPPTRRLIAVGSLTVMRRPSG